MRKDKRQKGMDCAKKWKDDEEVCLAMAMLESCPPGGKVNIAAYYKRAKDELDIEVSNRQLYEKMRRMRKRFRNIQNKLKEQNIEEDKFAFRTPQEPALFMIWKQIWGQNSDILQIEAGNPNPGEIVAENPNYGEILAENPNSMEIEARNPNSMGIESGNPNPRRIVVGNPSSMEIVTKKPKPKRIKAKIPNPREIVSGDLNPKVTEAENPNSGRSEAKNTSLTRNEVENPNFMEIVAGNPKARETKAEKPSSMRIRPWNPNPRKNEAENPCINEIVNSNSSETEGGNHKTGEGEVCCAANGDQSEDLHMHEHHDEDEEENGSEEWQSLQESLSQEALAANASINGRHQLLQGEIKDLEINIQSMIDNTRSRLEDVIESSFSYITHAASFQHSVGFGDGLEMGNRVFLSVMRRMKELMDSVDFVEQFPGVDAAEAQELQQKWRKINIQKVRVFSEHLALLNDQCKLFLKVVE